MDTDQNDLLSFKEYPLIEENYNSTAQLNIDSPKRTIPDPKLDDETEGQQSKNTASILSIEYYQQFFNVDTMVVVDRIATSMIPKRAPTTYLKLNIGTTPDLYGPIWIVITLIFTIAISGNIASYLQSAGEKFVWHYNFHLVSYASSAIITYVLFVPLALWAILKWSVKNDDIDLDIEESPFLPSLLSLLCLYGYSLSVYIPVSILWTIQYSLLQWLLVITGALLSGSVLVFTLMPALKNSKFSIFLMPGILGLHFILAAGFMLFFFHVPETVIEQHELPKIVTSTIKAIVINANKTII